MLLDAVIHVAAGAVRFRVEGARADLLRGQGGGDEARVRPLREVLGFTHHWALGTRALKGSVVESAEHPAGRAGAKAGEMGRDPRGEARIEQASVLGEPEEELDARAYAMSDNEAARRLNQARAELLRSINNAQQPAA